MKNRKISTVGINPTLSDPFTSQTSKLGWRYFEANEVDRKKNSRQKGTGTKMAENFERKKIKFQPCSQPRHLPMTSQTIGLVVNKYTKLGKKGQKLTLSQGLPYLKIPLC